MRAFPRGKLVEIWGYNMADMTDKLIGLFVGAILAGALIPVALQQLAAGNTTGLSASTIALYAVISIAVIVAVVIAFFKTVK